MSINRKIAKELVKIAKIVASDEDYPEGVFKEVNIKLTFDSERNRYMISCPEWKYDGAGGSDPSIAVSRLVKEIVKHNKEEVVLK